MVRGPAHLNQKDEMDIPIVDPEEYEAYIRARESGVDARSATDGAKDVADTKAMLPVMWFKLAMVGIATANFVAMFFYPQDWGWQTRLGIFAFSMTIGAVASVPLVIKAHSVAVWIFYTIIILLFASLLPIALSG